MMTRMLFTEEKIDNGTIMENGQIQNIFDVSAVYSLACEQIGLD